MSRPDTIVNLVSMRYNIGVSDSAKIAALLERLGNLIRAERRSSAGGESLEPVHRGILGYLSVCNRYSDTPAAITEFLGATKGTTSQSIGILERKGYLRKRSDKEDGRVVRLGLTAKGRRFAEGGIPPAGFKSALGDMNPADRDKLSELLTGLLAGLQRRNFGRTFGVCHTCSHFRRDGLAGSHQCGLTLEPLTDDESLKICREHETAA